MSLNTPPQQYKITTPHFVIIGIGVVIFVALFFVERTPPLDNKKQLNNSAEPSEHRDNNVPQQNSSVENESLSLKDLPNLTESQSMIANALQKLSKSKNKQDSIFSINQIVRNSLETGRMDYASAYQELLYEIEPSDSTLRTAAKYTKQACDFFLSENRSQLAEKARTKAVQLFEKYLNKNAKDLDAQIDLALLHVESSQPMTGIQKLVQIAQEKPENYRVQLELGIFSLNTSQLAKAEERLKKVIEIESSRWEGHYYLGLTYRQGQKNNDAKIAFQNAKKYAKDRVILDEIENQINSLN